MTNDWNNFTPLSAWADGLLIGGAAGLLVIFKGRIAGSSGIVGTLLQRPPKNDRRAIAFIAGLHLSLWI